MRSFLPIYARDEHHASAGTEGAAAKSVLGKAVLDTAEKHLARMLARSSPTN